MTVLETDVLVVGGGLAGLCAALEARRFERRVLLVAKRRAGRSGNSILAACNISGAFADGEDTVEDFVRDTLASGREIGEPELVRALAEGSGEAISFLEDCGIPFFRDCGRLQYKLVPGHRRPRTICTQRSGIPVQTAGMSLTLPLMAAVHEAGVEFLENATVVHLFKEEGRVQGALAAGKDGGFLQINCGAVVLACGGGGRLYACSNNTREITGDGFALAYEAGARLRDMEFVQFHPAMGIAPAKVILPTTLFGDGAVLKNRKGERFLAKSVPVGERGATRDEMSRAIFREVEEGRGIEGGVFLDISAVSDASARSRYRDLWELLARRGLDPQKEPAVVGLAVHFMMGGMVIDRSGASTVAGLFGAGEVTGGVHGANRLGGNALMEAVVFGRMAGRSAAIKTRYPTIARRVDFELPPFGGSVRELAEVRREVRSILWQEAGVIRSAATLERGLARWEEVARQFSRCGAAGELPLWFETRNMVTVSRLILEAALRRTESRGAHFRSDFPLTDDEQLKGSLWVEKDPHHSGPFISFQQAG